MSYQTWSKREEDLRVSFTIYKKRIVHEKRENRTRKLHTFSSRQRSLFVRTHTYARSLFFFFFSITSSTLAMSGEDKERREKKKWWTVSCVQLIFVGNIRWEISIDECERLRREKVWNQSSLQCIMIERMTCSCIYIFPWYSSAKTSHLYKKWWQ
jgi:hypothetical protein